MRSKIDCFKRIYHARRWRDLVNGPGNINICQQTDPLTSRPASPTCLSLIGTYPCGLSMFECTTGRKLLLGASRHSEGGDRPLPLQHDMRLLLMA